MNFVKNLVGSLTNNFYEKVVRTTKYIYDIRVHDVKKLIYNLIIMV